MLNVSTTTLLLSVGFELLNLQVGVIGSATNEAPLQSRARGQLLGHLLSLHVFSSKWEST